AVSDDGDGVALDREAPGVLGLLRDGGGDPTDAGGVGHGQVVTGLQCDLGADLDLAPEVEQEGAVGDLVDVDAVDGVDRLDDAVGVLDVEAGAGHVDGEPVVPGVGDVDGGDDAALLCDDGGHPAHDRVVRGGVQ